MRLKGKVAVITGGAQGIGRAIAETFAKEGANVALLDVLLDVVQKTAADIKHQYGTEAIAVKVDVTKFEDVEAGIKQVVDRFGKIDVLVNNAGITKDNLVLRMSDAEWDAVLAVNLKGPFNCTKAVFSPMRKAGGGRIINVASIVGLMGNAGQANYAASKGGVIALTKTCAREFAKKNIQVNAIAPGFIKTAMTEKLADDAKAALAAQIPQERLGEPQDVANAALFLASEESSYITGQVLSVNGGMYM
ncbi:MAG: 3-oxoacyl-[acyl-carrier-protein] reductase [Elusimicrobia bacterium]|nr:3-oxoacyl-[acyl-carrier-protein] reductase [Candidatus Obscuribacterium magneticum]